MEQEIENKVAKSQLITVDLEDYYPEGERAPVDIKDFLSGGIILREKDFRKQVNTIDWSKYKDKYVALHCSADAVIPVWAFMLLVVHLEPHAKKVIFGDIKTLETILYTEALEKLDTEKYNGKKLVIKGCGNKPVPESAYVELTRRLRPVAKSIMFGEACSTVPLYKKKQ